MKLPIRIQNNKVCRVIVCCFFMAILFSQRAFAQPTISSISPTSAAVGATITITGTNFSAVTTNNHVLIGRVKATVTAASSTSLSVTVPAGVVSHAPISVLNKTTNLWATSSQFFKPAFTPNKLPLINADLTLEGVIDSNDPVGLYGFTTADFDDDGKLDIAFSDGATTTKSVYVRRNISTTSIAFASAITVTENGLTQPGKLFAIADLDGDAKQDIIVPGTLSNNVVILRNTSVGGTISFTSVVESTGLSGTFATVAADFDGDGKIDIASAANGINRLIVSMNTSSGPGTISFSPTTLSLGSSDFYSLAVADINDDGKPDIIGVTSGADLEVYRNTSTPGSMSFVLTTVSSVITQAFGLVVGDIDGDAKPDIIVGSQGNSPYANQFATLRNTSVGTTISFSQVNVSFDPSPAPGYTLDYPALADINGDGKLDFIVCLNYPAAVPANRIHRVAVFNNTSSTGSISFLSDYVAQYTGNFLNIHGTVLAGDFSGDGKPDILAALNAFAKIAVFRNTLQFAPTISSVSPLSAAPGASVVITGTNFNATATSNVVSFGTVTATVTAASTTSLTATVPLNAGYAPLTVLNTTSTLSALSQDRFLPVVTPNKSTLAATDFVQQSSFSVTGQLYGLAAADLTGDKKPELVVSNSTGNSLLILTNATITGGAITFTGPTTFTPGASFDNPRYVSIADLDGNGWPDLVIPSYSLSTVGVFLNSGTGTVATAFTLTGSFTTGAGPIGVATGDLDGDGKPDIVTSNNFSSTVSIFRNTSTTTNAVSFAAKQDYTVSAGDAVYDLTLADIDNDGKLDIVTGRDINSNFGKVVLLRNTSTLGIISFAAAVEVAGTKAPWGFIPGDLNGDGLTDLVVGAAGSGATDIFAYTKLASGGALTNLGTTQLNVGANSVAIGLADLNGDGKPDVIAGTRSGSPGYHTYVYPNTSSGGATGFGTSIDLPASAVPWSMLATDLNGDGRPDIVMGSQLGGPSTITIYRNALVAPPVTQASGITVTSLTGTSATLSWTGGSGSKRAVFIRADNTGTAAPVTGTDYTANTVFGSGSQIGSTGWYCVYNGTGNLVSLSGLTPSTSYRAMVTEFNDGGLSNTAQYNTSSATNNPVTFTARATVTSISRTTTSATINTSTADFRLGFNAGMTGLSTSNFGLATTGITGASVTAVTGSGTTFTVTVNTGSGDGTLGLNLANTAGMVPDVTNALPFTGEVYTLDKTVPTLSTVTITSNNSNSSRARTGNLVSLAFTSGETINTPVVTLAGHTVAATNTSGNNWTASYTMAGTDAEGAVSFNIVFSDIAGNTGVAVSATTNSSSVIFDRTAPTLSAVTITTNNSNTSLARQGNIVTLSFTASETINTPAVTIAGHTVTASNSSGNNWTASYTMTGTDAEGAVAFSIAFSDLTGNTGSTVTGTTNSSSVAYDITAPVLSSVTIASSNSNTAKAKTGDVVSVVFSATEAITPTAIIAGHAVTPVNTGGNNWKASYTMTGVDTEGTITFSIAYSDASGNGGTTITTSSNSSNVVFDRTLPSLSLVTIVSDNANTGRAKTGNTVTLNFTADETIQAPTVSIATHGITAINTAGNVWSASYTMTGTDAEGTVPFSIAFNDLPGNAGTTIVFTTNSSSVVFDRTVPTLTAVAIISNNLNTAWAKTGNTITVNFTASENILVPVMNIAAQPVTAVNTTGNVWTASYTTTTTDAEGPVPFSIAFTDISGNAGIAVSATTNSSSVVFDKTAPSLSSVVIASGNSNAGYARLGDLVTVNFTGSEALLTPVMTIATHSITPVNITANAWTGSYTMTGTDAEGSVPISIAFTDRAGNAGISATGTTDNSNVLYDITRPVLSVVSIVSNNAISSVANPGNTITLSFVANESVLTPTVTLAGHTVSASKTGARSWTAVYIMQLTDAPGTIAYNITFSDSAGNTGTPVSATTDGSKVDFIIPPGPHFTGGAAQGLTACVNAGLTAINSLMSVTSISKTATLTWSVLIAPAHGSLSGFNTTAAANGGTVTPAGLGYQAFAGYSGADAFTVRISDGTFSDTTTINVTVIALPVGSITSAGGTILCTGSSLTLTASGGSSYKWFKDGTLVSGSSGAQLVITTKGIYTATIINAAGCEAAATNSITITQVLQPKADFTPDANNCIKLSLQFTNTSVTANSGAVSYLWNDGKGITSTAASPSFSYAQPGIYNVKLKLTPQDCPALADSITKTITIVQPAAGIRNPTVDVAKNQLTQLTVRGLPGASYQWSPAKFLLVADVASPGIFASSEQEYLIAQKVAGGCVTVDTLLVRLHENTTAYLPNVFTPNGDGQNDVLMPNLVGVKQLRFFRIFNRWGNMLFETTNIGVGWDGKYKGVLQPLDTYTWSIEGFDGNGVFVKRQGSVTLIR